MKKDNKDFECYRDELFSAMYSRITEIFPSYYFMEKGKKMVSQYHLNGMKDKQGKYILNISQSKPYSVYDLSHGEAKNLISWYMEINSVDFKEAVNQIADKCSIQRFPWGSSYNGEEARQSQEMEQDLQIFTSSLWSNLPEAIKVREYLHQRGWIDQEIQHAEIGVISSTMQNAVSSTNKEKYFMKFADVEIGVTHLLTIPIRRGSRLMGFKFREIGTKTSNKYIFSKGCSKSANLAALPVGVKDLVIVESEMDALHIQAKGWNAIAATSGGGISQEQMETAIRRGIKRFTLLFDADDKGREFTDKSIDLLYNKGVEVYVASLPDGYKDTDEFLQSNPISAWEECIRQARAGFVDRFIQIQNKYTAICQKTGVLESKDIADFYKEIESILLTRYLLDNPQYRGMIFALLEDIAPSLNLDVNDFREYISKSAERIQEERGKNNLKKGLSDVSEVINKGSLSDAVSLLSDVAEESRLHQHKQEFNSLLRYDIGEEIRELSTQPTGFYTNFYLEGHSEPPYRFYVPAGEITVIAGMTGHGKSKLLANIALSLIQQGSRGTILYISYEESQMDVVKHLINCYANLNLTSTTGKQGNRQIIDEYFRTQNSNCIGIETRTQFVKKSNEHIQHHQDDKIRVIAPTDNTATSLCDLLRYAFSEYDVSAIFIDYAQELYMPEKKNSTRTDELKQAMVMVGEIAKEFSIPIVLAAQLSNKDVKSPLTMSKNHIADSSWIARKASEVLLFWSNKEDVADGREKDEINRKHPDLNPGEGGRMLLKLDKTRYTSVGKTAIVSINGNTGYIHPELLNAPFPSVRRATYGNGQSKEWNGNIFKL